MIDDQNLDALLAAAMPTAEPDQDRVLRARRAAYAQRTRTKRSRRVAIAALAGTSVLAVGAGAAATVGVPFVGGSEPTTHLQVISNGNTCSTSFVLSSFGASKASLAAAQRALRTLNIDDLDISVALQNRLKEAENSEWEGPGPKPSVSELLGSVDLQETGALSDAVFTAVQQQVQAEGLGTTGLAMEYRNDCPNSQEATSK